jgi:hypothetical protein
LGFSAGIGVFGPIVSASLSSFFFLLVEETRILSERNTKRIKHILHSAVWP